MNAYDSEPSFYAYVAGNPLNMTDPSGLCGLWGDDVCGWASTTYNVVATVVEAPVAVTQSVLLNAESVVSEVPYGIYRGAKWVNDHSNIWGVRTVMSGLQRAGLWGDKIMDNIQSCTGYPQSSPPGVPNANDEGQPVHIFPSIIYPTPGADGWWKWNQNKTAFGPTTTGPGVNPNGSEDYSDH